MLMLQLHMRQKAGPYKLQDSYVMLWTRSLSYYLRVKGFKKRSAVEAELFAMD